MLFCSINVYKEPRQEKHYDETASLLLRCDLVVAVNEKLSKISELRRSLP